MLGVNKAILVGYLGRDPKTICSRAGVHISTFAVATNESPELRGGSSKGTVWHNIAAHGELGRECGVRLRKGALVYVEGRMNPRPHTTDDGSIRYEPWVEADTVELLSPPRKRRREGSHD